MTRLILPTLRLAEFLISPQKTTRNAQLRNEKPSSTNVEVFSASVILVGRISVSRAVTKLLD